MIDPIYKTLLHRVLSGIAHDPIEIEERWTGLHRCILIVTCSGSDIGILSGKGAAVIKAVQELFGQIGRLKKDEVKVGLNPVGNKGEKQNRTKGWSEDEALDYGFELLKELWFKPVSVTLEPFRGGHGLSVVPPVNEWHSQINTVLEAYGRSRAKAFGLAE